MINDELLRYIRQQLSIGVGKESITTNLKSQGWTEADLNEDFLAISPVVPASSVSVSPVQPTQENFPNPTHHVGNKIIPGIILLILLALIGGAAVYAYYTGYFVELPKLFSESIKKNAATVTSAKYDINLDVDISEIQALNSTPPPFGVNFKKFSFNGNGMADISDLKNPKFSSVISFTMGSLFTSAELRLINSTLYAQLLKAPIFGVLPMPTLSAYENKWFSLSYKPEDLEKLKTLGEQFSVDPNDITNQLTPEQRDHLLKMFQDANLLKTINRLGPETVGGESSYHFSFDFDRGAVVSLVQSIYEYLGPIYKSKNNFSLAPFNSALLAEELDKIKNFQGEIWIGRNDKLIHKLSVNFGVQPDLAKGGQVKVNAGIVYSDYNKSASIVAPTESISLNDVIMASLDNAKQKGKEASIKANLSNMRAQAEFFYDQNHSKGYSGFCLSKELITARKAIEGAGGTGFVCKDTSSKYAIGVKLSPNSGNWCIDSTGVSKAVATLPVGSACPSL